MEKTSKSIFNGLGLVYELPRIAFHHVGGAGLRKVSDSNIIEMIRKHALEAIFLARQSSCKISKCGAVIHDTRLMRTLGAGFNSPHQNVPVKCFKETVRSRKGFRSDANCCIHAEQRAINDAIKNMPSNSEASDFFSRSQLTFIRLDLYDKLIPSGYPKCTICSKEALDVGVREWVLLHDKSLMDSSEDFFVIYGSRAYNEISFEFPVFKFKLK